MDEEEEEEEVGDAMWKPVSDEDDDDDLLDNVAAAAAEGAYKYDVLCNSRVGASKTIGDPSCKDLRRHSHNKMTNNAT